MGQTRTIVHIDTKGNRRIVVSREPDGFRLDEFNRETEKAPWRYHRTWVDGRDRDEISRILSAEWR